MKKIWMLSAAAAVMLAACSETENVTPEVETQPETEETSSAEATKPTTEQKEQSENANGEVTEAEQEDTVEQEEAPKDPIEDADSETVDTEVEKTPEEEIIDDADSETVTDDSSSEIEAAGEITYMQNGEAHTSPTTFKTSGEQPFGLEVINGFSLIAEEPGKDQLVFDSNPEINMAIETATLGETVYDDLFERAMEKAGVLGEITPIEELPYHDNIKNIAAFQVDVDGEQVIVMAIETPTILAQFTIYDSPSIDMKQAFIQMAATIQGQ